MSDGRTPRGKVKIPNVVQVTEGQSVQAKNQAASSGTTLMVYPGADWTGYTPKLGVVVADLLGMASKTRRNPVAVPYMNKPMIALCANDGVAHRPLAEDAITGGMWGWLDSDANRPGTDFHDIPEWSAAGNYVAGDIVRGRDSVSQRNVYLALKASNGVNPQSYYTYRGWDAATRAYVDKVNDGGAFGDGTEWYRLHGCGELNNERGISPAQYAAFKGVPIGHVLVTGGYFGPSPSTAPTLVMLTDEEIQLLWLVAGCEIGAQSRIHYAGADDTPTFDWIWNEIISPAWDLRSRSGDYKNFGGGVQTIAVAAGGTGYVTGDVVDIDGGVGGAAMVTATDGVVTAVKLLTAGMGYSIDATTSTTAHTGAGEGLVLNVSAVLDYGWGQPTFSGTGATDPVMQRMGLLCRAFSEPGDWSLSEDLALANVDTRMGYIWKAINDTYDCTMTYGQNNGGLYGAACSRNVSGLDFWELAGLTKEQIKARLLTGGAQRIVLWFDGPTQTASGGNPERTLLNFTGIIDALAALRADGDCMLVSPTTCITAVPGPGTMAAWGGFHNGDFAQWADGNLPELADDGVPSIGWYRGAAAGGVGALAIDTGTLKFTRGASGWNTAFCTCSQLVTGEVNAIRITGAKTSGTGVKLKVSIAIYGKIAGVEKSVQYALAIDPNDVLDATERTIFLAAGVPEWAMDYRINISASGGAEGNTVQITKIEGCVA